MVINKSEPIDKEEINLFNFNEVEATAETTLEAEVKELQNPKVRKPKSKNHSKIDFEKYVTKTIIHDPSESVQGSFENISEESVYKAHVKVNIEVTKHVFKTIKNKETGELLTNTRDFAFNNYIATPSLVSYLANEKYLMGTPLYRQEQAFLSAGFFLSRVDQSNYLMTSSNTLPILSISEVSTD